MLTQKQLKLLNSYSDKAHVSSVLCDECSKFYSYLKSFVNVPLILSSSIMTVLNSSTFNSEEMKIPNIIINATTALILALINNFKIPEKVQTFKISSIKFNKLCHLIEDKITNDNENINVEFIRQVIHEYESIEENLEFYYIDFIKTKIIKKYKNKKVLPNSLNLLGRSTTTLTQVSNLQIDTDISEDSNNDIQLTPVNSI